jgi:ferredoxin
MTRPGIRISVHAGLCARSGYCERLAPKIFRIPDDGDPVTVPAELITDAADIGRVREAESVCPTGAISVQTSTRQGD